MGVYQDWFIHDFCPRRGLHPIDEQTAVDLAIKELARLLDRS
jgi:hypothetical protein